MKKKVKMLILAALSGLLFCILLVACQNNQVREVQDYPSRPLSFRPMEIDTFIGRPYMIGVLDETLILLDAVDGYHALLHDLAGGANLRVLKEGQGPGELIAPLDMYVSQEDKTVSFLQRQMGSCHTYRLDDLWRSAVDSFEHVNFMSADRAVRTEDGYVSAGFYADGIIHFYDRQGRLEQAVDLYPEWQSADSVGRYVLLQGYIDYSPKSRCLMYASSFASDIFFYRKEGSIWRQTSVFPMGKARLEERLSESSLWKLRGDDVYRCFDVCHSDHYFYVLYDGRTFSVSQQGTPTQERKRGERVYVIRFTVEGAFDAVYEVDPTVLGIAVSSDDTWMYAIYVGEDGEYAVGKASLAG